MGAVLIVVFAAVAGAQPAPGEDIWIVAGGLVVVMDDAGTVIPDGGVAIRANRIEAVGPAAELLQRFPAARRLDATGRVVMPGLVNAHTHVPMTLFRGVADDLDLEGFLYKRIFPLEAR
ncbi:MAG: hypothetical protein C3F15_06600, partial [Holophagae bacterium]